ncbi:MAG TPA: DUF2314 domain-containing protein [Desulfomonilaceae bacterium]|nr:DUF2314 domain-containing protein [Desulfomonilaceae bacterium]
MLQVRCPECGYLQTLSEERFLSISENFLNCPHCNAKVPKEWKPQQEESVPEEARHKMLAFSKRILNGRDTRLEVVYALESLVRHYGATQETNKALGIGYAAVGEYRKAEEFLLKSLHEASSDPEILRSLLRALLAQKKFKDAADQGNALLEILGSAAEDEDVAGVATALIGIDKKDQARALLDSHPDLDPRNPMVKQVRRELIRSARTGIRTLFRESRPGQWLLAKVRKEVSVESVGGATERAVETRNDNLNIARSVPSARQVSGIRRPGPIKSPRIDALLEYWIYTPENNIPRWEHIRYALAENHSSRDEMERSLALLDLFIQRDVLTAEYIRKSDVLELFEYPEDIIPHNSRDVDETDRKVLQDARMIVRLKLCLADFAGTDHLVFMVGLIEAVRSLTSGVVQDAVSHTLWGTETWKKMVGNPTQHLIESHVQFEMVDEGNVLWIHTHGMQKFGLPDLEMEEVPTQLASPARTMMTLAAEALLSIQHRQKSMRSPLVIAGTPFLVEVQQQPSDKEEHFPAGSFRLVPHAANREPQAMETTGEILAAFSAYLTSNSPSGPDRTALEHESNSARLKENMLCAHERAQKELTIFKKSFQGSGRADLRVHAVKVGFPAQGGQFEWMWVSLDAWQGEFVAGQVENTPVLRKDLEKGSRVKIGEKEIFDWVITQEGKVLQGGYTERIPA